MQDQIKTISLHFFHVIIFPCESQGGATYQILNPPCWVSWKPAIAAVKEQIFLFSGSKKYGSSSLSMGSKRRTFIWLNTHPGNRKTLGKVRKSLLTCFKVKHVLKCFFGQRPSFFPSFRRSGGRKSVNVPTALRLLCFVPTCAFQLSAPADVSGLALQRTSLFQTQRRAVTTSTAEDQTLGWLEIDGNCRKIFSAMEKGGNKGVV